MKRSISLLLAMAAVLSMGLNALALEYSGSPATTTATESRAATGGLVLDKALGSDVALKGLLAPNQTLRFPILVADSDGNRPLTDKDLEGARLRVENQRNSSAVLSVKVVEEGSGYALEVKTLSGYPTDIRNYEGQLKLLKKSDGTVLRSVELSFSVGYASVSDNAVEEAAQGDTLYLDKNAPVITQKQFETMDDTLNGRKATLAGTNWTYEVRVTGQDSVNLVYDNRSVKEILTQYEDQDFVFLSFPAGPAFDFTGTLTLDVSGEEFEDYYVYSYYNGRLNRVYADYDAYDETLSFQTKYLGRFVLTDTEIKNGAQIQGGSSGSGSNNNNTAIKPNPGSGAF